MMANALLASLFVPRRWLVQVGVGMARVAAGTPGKRCGDGMADGIVVVVVMRCLDGWRGLQRGDVASACLNAVFVGG
jgi:hypothetical protein